MTYDGRPPPPPGGGPEYPPGDFHGGVPDRRDAPREDMGDMHPLARQQMMTEQRMMEAKLEEIRSYRQQKQGRVSRVMNLFFVFSIAGGIAFLLDAKGMSPKVSITASIVTLVIIASIWAYRKPY